MNAIKFYFGLIFILLSGLLLTACGPSYGKLDAGDLVATGDAMFSKFGFKK